MIKHETHIDTVAIQLDNSTGERQRMKLNILTNFITNRGLGYIARDNLKSGQINILNVYYGYSKIATIHSGITKKRDYYIRIKFAGLKSYNKQSDEKSYSCLMEICGMLNTSNTIFRLVELDIALDTYSPFNNLLAICTRRAANVKYNPIGHKQFFNSVPTSYIEDYRNPSQKKNAVLRAYLYNKSAKEGFLKPITRFELKLQNRYFLKNNFYVDSIIDAFDRYHVLYFSTIDKMQEMVKEYNKYERVTAREVNYLKLDKHRLYLDSDVVANFIRKIQSSYIDFYGKLAWH